MMPCVFKLAGCWK